MKLSHKLLIVISMFSSTALPQPTQFSPANTILISDVNDVVTEPSFLFNSVAQLGRLVKKDSDTNNERSNKKNKSVNGGVALHMLYHSMRKPYLAPYTAWFTDYLEESQHMIDGTQKIYHYLKDAKGYSIIFATNQDHIAYDIAAHALGNTFTSIPDKVFIAHPSNSPELLAQLQAFADQPTTPDSYKELLHKVLTIQPTETILHVPDKKPNLGYYQYVEQHLDATKNMIFIDDKLENVRGFEELQKTSLAERVGIQFKDPKQLAQAFVNLGILSEQDDKQLLQDIRYPGIWGKMKLGAQNLLTKSTKPLAS